MSSWRILLNNQASIRHEVTFNTMGDDPMYV